MPTPETTAEPTKNISYTAALDLLTQISNTSKYAVWIPSLDKEVYFRELNIGQQKEILQAIVDSPFYRTRFITTFYKIIKENFAGSEVLDLFTIYDKQLILLKTRIECFGVIYNMEGRQIDLSELYEKAKISLPNIPKTLECDSDISIDVLLPTIKTEFDLETEFRKNAEVSDVNDTNSLRKTLGELFISEITKYIAKIKIKDSIIDFSKLKSFKNRIDILEKMPNKVIQNVIEFIDEKKQLIDNVTTITVPNTEKEGTTTETINMDSTFFSIGS